ncbi:MAG: hypothetical protein K2Z81_16290 [Cyanobacteria bacterium]|nr:hypothetical protein [Cyanobacteriota bacterium]
MQELCRTKSVPPKEELVACSSFAIIVSVAFGVAYGTGILTLAAGLVPFCLALVEICGVAIGAPTVILGIMHLQDSPLVGVKKIVIGASLMCLGICAPDPSFTGVWAPIPVDMHLPDFTV